MNSDAEVREEVALSRGKAAATGAWAGLIAGIFMTTVMLLAARMFGLATPLVLLGDRLSVFIQADTFLELMGKVGGYNHMKQLGVGGVMAGQLLVGAVGGIVYGLVSRDRTRKPGLSFSLGVFVVLPLVAASALLWPVLGTHYAGWPIPSARVVTLVGLFVSFLVFERTLVLVFRGMTGRPSTVSRSDLAYSPPIGRRALLVGGAGLIVAGGAASLVRVLWRAATFSYDGTQYKGGGVQAITPNDQFYCVTKNVIDPVVQESAWRLEITGLVQTPQRYGIEQLRNLPPVAQETTLMCISNGLDAGLMSNAVWKGVPMRVLLQAAGPSPTARKVKLFGVDNYTDTFPIEKAMEPTTLIAYEMNGEALPHRHGFPARAIVPGYFGEKHVKWITRIELAGEDGGGVLRKAGLGSGLFGADSDADRSAGA